MLIQKVSRGLTQKVSRREFGNCEFYGKSGEFNEKYVYCFQSSLNTNSILTIIFGSILNLLTYLLSNIQSLTSLHCSVNSGSSEKTIFIKKCLFKNHFLELFFNYVFRLFILLYHLLQFIRNNGFSMFVHSQLQPSLNGIN